MATYTAASVSRTDVAAAIALATDGDAVMIPAGTAGWMSTITITAGITLCGAGIGKTIIIDDIIDVNSQQLLIWTTAANKSYRMTGIEFDRALKNVTGNAATNVLTTTAHNLTVNDTISFTINAATTLDPTAIALAGGAGITANTTYYVLTVPTANTFTISASQGGAELDFTTDITAGQWTRFRSNWVQGTIRVAGFSSAVQIDHCKFWNLQNENINWFNAYGVINSCIFQFDGGAFRALMAAHRAVNTGGVDDGWGDSSWENGINWKGDRFAVFLEDCVCGRNGTSSTNVYGITDAISGGGRIVVRYCTVQNNRVSSHGTESSQRYRGGRILEAYGNTFNSYFSPVSTVDAQILSRSATVIGWGNRFTGTFNSTLKLESYRSRGDYIPWGFADGTEAWDTANNGIFDTGIAITNSVNSAGDPTKNWTVNQWSGYCFRAITSFVSTTGDSTTVVVSGAGWSTNQWAGYGFTRNSDNAKGRVSTNTSSGLVLRSDYYRPTMNGTGTFGTGAFTLSLAGCISSNTATGVTTRASENGVSVTFPTGYYQIRQVNTVLDDPGLGITSTLTGTTPNNQSLNQQLDPCYMWDNLQRTGVGIDWSAGTQSVVSASTYTSLIENRNWYKQATSFDGTVGVGTGILANRPATCNSGVGYWAADVSTLYVGSGSNVWTAYYVPYTYPHPLRGPFPSPVRVGGHLRMKGYVNYYT